jgi:hypothetical protein
MVWGSVYSVFAVLLAAGAISKLEARIPQQYAGPRNLVSVLLAIAAAVWMRVW